MDGSGVTSAFECERCHALFPTSRARKRHRDRCEVLSEQIKRFAERHNFTCCWCNQPVRIDVPLTHPLSPTREHVIPKAIKAPGQVSSRALAHSACNHRRATMNADGFRRLMMGEAVTKADLWPE